MYCLENSQYQVEYILEILTCHGLFCVLSLIIPFFNKGKKLIMKDYSKPLKIIFDQMHRLRGKTKADKAR